MSATKLYTYFGIADAHGLESFIPDKSGNGSMLTGLQMRVAANRHRHACLYTAKLTQKAAKLIQSQVDNEEWVKALNTLKEIAVEINVPKDQHKSFKLIPNKDLDPYMIEIDDNDVEQRLKRLETHTLDIDKKLAIIKQKLNTINQLNIHDQLLANSQPSAAELADWSGLS